MKIHFSLGEREVVNELKKHGTLTVWRNAAHELTLVNNGLFGPGFEIEAIAGLAIRGYVAEQPADEGQPHLVLTPKGKRLHFRS